MYFSSVIITLSCLAFAQALPAALPVEASQSAQTAVGKKCFDFIDCFLVCTREEPPITPSPLTCFQLGEGFAKCDHSGTNGSLGGLLG